MKTLLLCSVILVGAAAISQADPVIKFDDLPGSAQQGLPMPAGYHLLSWSNFYYLDGVNFFLNPSGFQAGVVSANNVIYNFNSGMTTISGGMFDFVSASATAAFNDSLQLEAKGYIKGTLVYDQTNTLSATGPTLISYNFYGVDQVNFISSGGSHHAGYAGSGTHFALDNVNVVTYLPYNPLFVNGGFETGTFAGWNHGGNTTNDSVTTTLTYAHSGTYGAQLGPETTPGFLGQTIPTQIGQSYSVSFSLENFGSSANSFLMSWGNYPVFGFTNHASFAWTNLHFDLIASRPSEFLGFQYVNTPSFFGLDDFSVTPTVLVSNGGFETSDFSGWIHTGITNQDSVIAAGARSGTYEARFGASGAPGFISQSVATQPGQPYLFSAWLNSSSGGTPNEFHVSWDGQSLADQTNLAAVGWTNLHYSVLSGDTQNTIQFGFRDDPSYLFLDEVSVVPVPILQNGGFEFGDFTGWTRTGNTASSLVTTNALYANTNTGFYGGQFGPSVTPGFISQTFSTVPGQCYLIGLMLYNPTAMTGVQEFKVLWNGAVLMDTTNLALTGWLPYQFAVTASGANSTLQLGLRDDPSYLGLDDVFVSPIPQPVFQSIVRTNNSVDVSWSASPGYIYQLQYTTNLSQPNWTNVTSYFFPTNFPMTATDTNAPNPVRFYRVQMAPPPLIF